MKIKITLTVDIDPASWANEFGITPSEVRDDVRSYAEGCVRQSQGILDNEVER